MKYVIIASVITSILAFTAYILDFTNNKTDKFFLIIVGSILILSGLFFSIRGEVFKENESKAQIESLSKTKKNTEKIIENINENIERLSIINDSVTKLSSALSGVESDLTKQLKIFKNTLNHTKIFEQKVSEQLKLEKKRFKLERPKVEVVAKLEKNLDMQGNQYGILFEFKNIGKRVAKDFNSHAIIGISEDNKNITKHIKMGTIQEKFDISSANSGGVQYAIRSEKSIDITEIEENLRLVILLKYTYKDEFLTELYEEEKHFFWYGFNRNGLILSSGKNSSSIERLNKYIKDNNL